METVRVHLQSFKQEKTKTRPVSTETSDVVARVLAARDAQRNPDRAEKRAAECGRITYREIA